MRTLILAALLLLPLPVGAADVPPPAQCTVVVLDVWQLQPPPPNPGNVVSAQLDMQGHWKVSSWPDIAWAASHATDATVKCIASELLVQRKSLPMTTEADLRCQYDADVSPFSTKTWLLMQRIMWADPVMRACQPPVTCNTWNTCS